MRKTNYFDDISAKDDTFEVIARHFEGHIFAPYPKFKSG